MKRCSLSFQAVVCVCLLYVVVQPASIARDPNGAPAKRLAMAMPHAKAEKKAGVDTRSMSRDSQMSQPVSVLTDSENTNGRPVQAETGSASTGLPGWVGAVFKSGIPMVTPIAVPKFSHKDFVQLPERTTLERMRRLWFPQGLNGR